MSEPAWIRSGIARTAANCAIAAAICISSIGMAHAASVKDAVTEHIHAPSITVQSTAAGKPNLYASNNESGCNVIITGNKLIGPWLSSQTGFRNQQLAKDFAEHHAKARCDLSLDRDHNIVFSPDQALKLSALAQERLTKLIHLAPNHPFSKLFAANYADTIAAMSLLRENNYSKEVIASLTVMADKREAVERLNFGSSHDLPNQTSRALRRVISDVTQIRTINDTDAMIRLAAEIATSSAMSAAAASPTRFSVDSGAANVVAMEQAMVRDNAPKEMGVMGTSEDLDVATAIADIEHHSVDEIQKILVGDNFIYDNPDKFASHVRSELRNFCSDTSMKAAREHTDMWRENKAKSKNTY